MSLPFSPPRVKYTSGTKITWDGNSFVSGVGASGTGTRWPAQTYAGLPASGAQAMNAVGISGQTWQNMDGISTSSNSSASASDVDGSFDSTKTNVLVCGETTNAVWNDGRTAAQVIADMRSYIANRLAANPGWKILLYGTIPRSTTPNAPSSGTWGSGQAAVNAANAALIQVDAWCAANWKAIGCKGFVDLRQSGSPYAFSDFTAEAGGFATAAAFYNRPSDYCHPNDAGYALLAGYINAGLRRLLAK